MKKLLISYFLQERGKWEKVFLIMRLSILFTFAAIINVTASGYSQTVKIDLELKNATLQQVFQSIQEQTEFDFFYKNEHLPHNKVINRSYKNIRVDEILDEVLEGTGLIYRVMNTDIVITKGPAGASDSHRLTSSESNQQSRMVTGKITDPGGQPLPGVTIVVKGTTQGTITNTDGEYTITNIPEDATLVFSFVGMRTQEVVVGSQVNINVVMEEDVIGLDEVIAIGYGTMKKSDLTGSVVRVDQEIITERPNISVMQSLQGSSPGLNVGQVNAAGEEPSISIRGRNSISGAQAPLIVLDGVIFRGRLIDINPNDVESIDILKDASSAAIYGSQATNGVIIITTKTGKIEDKPIINYNSRYSFQEPTKRFRPESPEDYVKRIEAAYAINGSRTPESGYLEPNPDWDISQMFRSNLQLWAYENNIVTDWYDIGTNDRMYTHNQDLSINKRTENSGYFMSVGYTDQVGYMANEGYSRWNARINVDNEVTDWLKIGVQSFLTSSDYSGDNLSPLAIYQHTPYCPAFHEDGSLVQNPRGVGDRVNPYYYIESDDFDKRLNLFGNIYADISLPFIKGLSFKTNFNTNYFTTSHYYYRDYANNFLGVGSKSEGIRSEWANDNILTYDRTFSDDHKVIVTLVYGSEKRDYTSTTATATEFVSDELGYNRLQAGSADLQTASSTAWSEASIYNMARLFYSFKNRYMITGTYRRDGFSGFSENNKFGDFPSLSLAWVASEEDFLQDVLGIFDLFKLRASYGSNGNRTISRYQTLAQVGGGYNYINGSKTPVYTQSITDLASPKLKWETTTGVNFGLDFALFDQRLSGAVDYYNSNTTNLLYNVDIPGLSRFETFPDNLGKLHNHGLEISLSSINVRSSDFEWSSHFIFSRNRNELRELLGFDNDGDGKEDDLISEGLFIGEPLSTIYHYYTDGSLWQVGDDIPSTADIGSYKIKDLTEDGIINPDDRMIIGYSDPAFRFSIDNKFNYRNWTLSVFLNSIMGNDKYYLGADDLASFNTFNDTMWDSINFPEGMDFWLPENPDARYQRLGVRISGITTRRYIPRSFVRLQDVNLSYNFNSELLNKIQIQNLRLYFNGKNLLTFTKWPGWDPETGEKITISGNPVIRNYTFGIDVTF